MECFPLPRHSERHRSRALRFEEEAKMTRNDDSHAGLQASPAGRVGVALLALIGFSTAVRADVVTDWNTIAVSTVSGDTLANRQSRDMAMVTAAIFDPIKTSRAYSKP